MSFLRFFSVLKYCCLECYNQKVTLSTFFQKKNKCFTTTTKGDVTWIFYFLFQNTDNERIKAEIIIYVIFTFLRITKKPTC
jgi:hypothetical protein